MLNFVAVVVMLLGLGRCAVHGFAGHAGLLQVPEFDAVVVAHLPTQIGEDFNPYAGKLRPGEHHFEQRKYGTGNEKLFQGDIAGTIADDNAASLKVHAGNWQNEVPDNIPDLDIGAIGYGRQWLGEDKMGGGWSSEALPLSGDRSKQQTLPNLASLDLNDEDPDYVWRTDAEGNRHRMPRKK